MKSADGQYLPLHHFLRTFSKDSLLPLMCIITFFPPYARFIRGGIFTKSANMFLSSSILNFSVVTVELLNDQSPVNSNAGSRLICIMGTFFSFAGRSFSFAGRSFSSRSPGIETFLIFDVSNEGFRCVT